MKEEKRWLIGEQILIATGSLPVLPSIAGLADVSYLTSDMLSSADDPWGTELREQPRSLLIEAAMALRFRATIDDFIDLIHVYPTMAEALKLVAISFTRDVNRLSCCAS